MKRTIPVLWFAVALTCFIVAIGIGVKAHAAGRMPVTANADGAGGGAAGSITNASAVKVLDARHRTSACFVITVASHCQWGNPQGEANPTPPTASVGLPIPAQSLVCENTTNDSLAMVHARVDCIADSTNGSFNTVEGD